MQANKLTVKKDGKTYFSNDYRIAHGFGKFRFTSPFGMKSIEVMPCTNVLFQGKVVKYFLTWDEAEKFVDQQIVATGSVAA